MSSNKCGGKMGFAVYGTSHSHGSQSVLSSGFRHLEMRLRLDESGVNALSRYKNGKTKPPLALVRLSKVLDKHPELLEEIKADIEKSNAEHSNSSAELQGKLIASPIRFYFFPADAAAFFSLVAEAGSTSFSKTYWKIKGATIVASDSITKRGVVSSSLPQVIFSLGTAPL